ncbi:MAG: hypothetical protein M1839_002700 [Geoglossum umbratile]|nr:MAG: hypothetical protein M1839_002700 [Geoglossum umbratile]
MSESTATSSEKRAQLESRYIELLEKRIAVLEGTFKTDTGSADGLDYFGPNAQGMPALNRQPTYEQFQYGYPQGPPEVTVSTEKHPADEEPQFVGEPSSRIRFRVLRFNEFGISQELSEEPDTQSAEKPQTKGPAYAFTWLKVMDLNGKYVRTDAHITSPPLRKLLWENLKHYRGFFMHGEPIELSPSFHPIVHNWTKLTDAASKECEDDLPEVKNARKDLGLLLKHIASLSEMAQIFRSINSQNNPRTITYDLLWIIFAPGSLVYSRPVLNKPQIFITQEFQYDHHPEECFVLTCWAYEWNGRTFDRVPFDIKIEKYTNTRAVNSLPVYPLEYYSERGGETALRGSLIERGKRFRELCTRQKGAQLFYYDGLAIPDRKGITRPEGPTESDDTSSALGSIGGGPVITGSGKGQQIKGQVIVDFQSYLMYVPGDAKMGSLISEGAYDDCNCSSCKANTALWDELRVGYDGVGPDKEFSDEQYLLCPPRVLGYFMQQKMWVQLLVSDVKEIEAQSENAFKRLVMAPTQKKLILSLVRNHGKLTRDGTGMRLKDIVDGKGEGLVILLHGPPGVGKTLTAESVAQAARKPLFSVTVADIGLEPADVEMNLRKLFDLANAWEAVLLFDEADVFMEARDTNDVTRNALVSVLLRIMEYYDGILILTTNRIKIFDLAIQSRIHLAVKYSELTAEDRRKICLGFFQQLNDDNTEDRKRIEDYINNDFDEEFNGRQIRNVFSSAIALAGEKKLTLQDIKAVVQNVRTFQKYLADETAVARRKLE